MGQGRVGLNGAQWGRMGAICGLHYDHSMTGESISATQCKKAFSYGTRSREECLFLLKRWRGFCRIHRVRWLACNSRIAQLLLAHCYSNILLERAVFMISQT